MTATNNNSTQKRSLFMTTPTTPTQSRNSDDASSASEEEETRGFGSFCGGGGGEESFELSGTLTCTVTQEQALYCWNLIVDNCTGRVAQNVDLCLDVRSLQNDAPFVLGPGRLWSRYATRRHLFCRSERVGERRGCCHVRGHRNVLSRIATSRRRVVVHSVRHIRVARAPRSTLRRCSTRRSASNRVRKTTTTHAESRVCRRRPCSSTAATPLRRPSSSVPSLSSGTARRQTSPRTRASTAPSTADCASLWTLRLAA